MISRYKNRIVLTVLLVGLIRFGFYVHGYFSPVNIETPGNTKTTISAEDIERILELNGASVRVSVVTDTSYVSVSVPSYFGFDVKFLEKQHLNRLVESRTWLIKAGVKDFSVRETDGKFVVELSSPQVTTREHLAEEYQERKRSGIWNPVTLTKLEMSSRAKAANKAIDNGLLSEAKLSITNALYEILPSNVELKWKNK